MWCVACCDTYPIRKAGCLYTEPSCGIVSPCVCIVTTFVPNKRIRVEHTVNNLIKVDFPAPFGPIMPTRDDKDNAQLMLYRLGVSLPGYVNVQLVILRMARVLLRTPIREPGGGKANLIEVAAKV